MREGRRASSTCWKEKMFVEFRADSRENLEALAEKRRECISIFLVRIEWGNAGRPNFQIAD